MKKRKMWAFLTLILPMILFAPVINAESPCSGISNGTNCACTDSPDGLLRLECVLDERQDLTLLFEKINLHSDKFDSIRVRECRRSIETLEPLPKLQIRSVEISNCGIKRVHEKAFDALADSLEELKLLNNSIGTMPFLKKLRKLQSINLNRNMLKDIPERSFDGLDQLHQLRLKHNRICILLPNALNETKTSLELLDLSHNCLVTVPAQNLRNSISLTHLNLAANQIREIAQMQFMNLPKLIELCLSENQLKRIAPNGFMNVPQLKHFLARDNLLQSFDGQTLQAFKQLEVIDLSGNNFQKVPSFKDHANLVQIEMDNNKIQRVDTLTFSANPKLSLVSLQNNAISTISRNSFDSLTVLTTLNLANNSLEFIERNMFDGMRSLKNVLLHDNAISDINAASFSSTPDLVVIDLSGNKLQKIREGTFARLPKLFFLDLSNNGLTTFEKGAFQTKVANIFLDGNQFNCDSDFDWFVMYLVQNSVRTFVPNQPEITCSAPPQLANVRLKELMMKKANDSQTMITNQQGSNRPSNFLAEFLPGLAGGISGSSTRNSGSIPALLSAGQQSSSPGVSGISSSLLSNSGNGMTANADVNQLLRTMPSMVVNIPGIGAVDISKLPPTLIEHVLKGGQIPGVSEDTLKAIVKQYTDRVYYNAIQTSSQGKQRSTLENSDAVGSYPSRLVTGIPRRPLAPHLRASSEQTQRLREFYSQQQVPADSNLTDLFSPKVIQMMKLLPPNYNLSKLPPETMKSVLAGEMPDLSLLPADLQQYLRDNVDHLFSSFSSNPNISVDEILKKLPKFEQILLPTFSPYDINKIDSDLVIGSENSEVFQARLYTAVALGLVAATTMVILGLFCFYLRSNRRREESPSSTNLTGAY